MYRSFIASVATISAIAVFTIGMMAMNGVQCQCVYGNCECYFAVSR
jgi:hypothetical protein